MSSSAQEEYDRVLYPGAAHPQTHPDRLATLAILFGMQPMALDRCRVLEIGCTDGGNLIPMAYELPNAEFVGIDVSARSLEIGRECVRSLGLKNIRLLECDIMDLAEDLGAFDYIIAHGIYSWVPPAVRHKMLAICNAHLAAQGVAYISYNVYPGSHLRDLVRGMMRYHVQELDDVEAKRKQAVALLRFVKDAQPEDDLFRNILAAELARIEKYTPAAFYHDDLADGTTPFYFHQFIADAAQQGLQFLAEAAFAEMQEQAFAPAVVETLHALGGDRIAREQYRDFLNCRRFRQTLLCRREVPLGGPFAANVRRLFISARATPTTESVQLADGVLQEFSAPDGASITTGNPLFKAALLFLAEQSPRAFAFDALLDAAVARAHEHGFSRGHEEAANELGEALLALYAAPLVRFHVRAPRFVTDISERPMSSALVRWSLAKGLRSFTTLRHRTAAIDDPLAAQLILLLDGTRDREALVGALASFAQTGSLIRDTDGTPLKEEAELRKIIAAGLEENLRKLARMALLVQ